MSFRKQVGKWSVYVANVYFRLPRENGDKTGSGSFVNMLIAFPIFYWYNCTKKGKIVIA